MLQSLSTVEEEFQLHQRSDDGFFREWYEATRISMETALLQVLTYMTAHPNHEAPVFGLVTNGHGFAFIKLQQTPQGNAYEFSDRFVLMSRQNQLYNVPDCLTHLRRFRQDEVYN